MNTAEEDLILSQVTFFIINDLLSPSSALQNSMAQCLNNEPMRNKNYFEVIIPSYSLDEFRLHFKMSRSCFSNIHKKLLFTIWMLSKQESFLSAGDRLDSKSTAHWAFCQILDVLCGLAGALIKWPSLSQYPDISWSFKEKSGGYIPGIIGAIDGCHIQIKQPLKNPIDYCNRKNTHSIILQGVCDHRAIFIDIYVGAPGRLHDARVFRNSVLYDKLDELIPPEYHLLGDAAYPSLRNLVTPFRDNGHLSQQKSHFNTRLSSARVTIERAFGLLKGRFRRLKYVDVAKPDMANKIIVASVVLHNHIHLFNTNDQNCDDFFEETVNLETVEPENSENTNSDQNHRPGNTKRDYLLSLF